MPHNHPDQWLDTTDFAKLADLTGRGARAALARCHEGGSWRGVSLDVTVVKGRGGRDGKSYRVRADSIPPNLRNAPATVVQVTPVEPTQAPAQPTEPTPAATACEVIPKGLPAPRPLSDEQNDAWAFKRDIVRRVLAAGPAGSADRARAVEAISAEAKCPRVFKKRSGKPVSVSSIRRWVAEYEAGGATALAPKERADRGRRRVVISRAWDDAAQEAGLSEEAIQDIRKTVDAEIARQFRGGRSWEGVQLNVMPVLVRASRAAGLDLPDETLTSLCNLSRHRIEPPRHRNRAAHMYRRDAGKSADIQMPRTKRDRSHLRPMDWVAGDVHHTDVLVRRPDDSLATPKFIAWADLATNRLFGNVVLKPKGEAVTRRDVLDSFAAMCCDPNWGVPGRLYLDNGSEYAALDELAGDMLALQRLFAPNMEIRDSKDLNQDLGVTKSRAYNPQSKIIETFFSILEKTILPQLTGHIGGERMKKKTQNQGKAPAPYDGDFTAFQGDFADSLAYYHNRPQSGHLARKSPNYRFGRFIADGWQSITLDPHQLEIAFSKVETRSINKGGVFSIGGTEYESDRLIGLGGSGARATVHVPLIGDGGRMYVFDEDDKEFLGIATERQIYRIDDPAGAMEQARKAAILRDFVTAQGPVPTDTRDSMRAINELLPAPQATSAGQMSINPEFQEAAHQARALSGAPARTDAEREDELGSCVFTRLAARGRQREAASG